jgi:capsule biosynthesis phosphatase
MTNPYTMIDPARYMQSSIGPVQKETIVFDLDGTLCEITGGGIEYFSAKPKMDVITRLNSFHNLGWKVVIYTARGMTTNKGDVQRCESLYRHWTEQWLKKYGVQYDELIFGKPAGDLYVDDKGVSVNDFAQGNIRTRP